VDVETRYFIILLKLIFKSECFGRGAIAEGGSTKLFFFTAFLMRPSVLYVVTVSNFFSFLTDAELRARAWGWSRRVFSLFSIDKRVKNAHYRLRRMDCLQMDLASTLLPVTRFLRGKKKIRDGRDEGDA
jgi:hypothetical protein